MNKYNVTSMKIGDHIFKCFTIILSARNNTSGHVELRMWQIIGMVAAASGLTGVLFLSICITSGVIIRRKSGIIHRHC